MIYDEKTIFIPPGEELILSSRKKKNKLKEQVPHRYVGETWMVRGKPKGYSYTDVLLTLSGPEQWLFKMIKDNVDYRNNIAVVVSSTLSKTEANKLFSAYKLLNQKDLVRRVGPNRYMVNPDAFVNLENHEQNKLLWDQL